MATGSLYPKRSVISSLFLNFPFFVFEIFHAIYIDRYICIYMSFCVSELGLKRCGKSCRLRWLNYLRPNIKHGGFSEEEDNIICSLYISIGSRFFTPQTIWVSFIFSMYSHLACLRA